MHYKIAILDEKIIRRKNILDQTSLDKTTFLQLRQHVIGWNIVRWNIVIQNVVRRNVVRQNVVRQNIVRLNVVRQIDVVPSQSKQRNQNLWLAEFIFQARLTVVEVCFGLNAFILIYKLLKQCIVRQFTQRHCYVLPKIPYTLAGFEPGSSFPQTFNCEKREIFVSILNMVLKYTMRIT
jgi:hypothetical protein